MCQRARCLRSDPLALKSAFKTWRVKHTGKSNFRWDVQTAEMTIVQAPRRAKARHLLVSAPELPLLTFNDEMTKVGCGATTLAHFEVGKQGLEG